jgi:uncharacterized protein (TIGR02145 family)
MKSMGTLKPFCLAIVTILAAIALVACQKDDTPDPLAGISDGTFTDPRDGHVYKYKIIGTQTWMAENLAYLPSVSSFSTSEYTSSCYYVYGYDGTNVSVAKGTANFGTYGVLYNFNAAVFACPTGWHLPFDDEWKVLEKNQGMSQSDADAAQWRSSGGVCGKLKEAGTSHWNSPNTGASNSVSFTALPGGYSSSAGFKDIGKSAYLWTASTNGTSNAWIRLLYYNKDAVSRFSNTRNFGASARCVKN